jgi:predicted enzyme related to lactoylglutathione lyase
VNEPSTWNWSDLSTRDVAAAAAFYSAVFGWQSMPVDFGFGEARMWRMPGYGDFLEQNDPGVRERHSEAGAPEGFTDAIAWLQPMTGDQVANNEQPHWSVTFSVDDADAVAERAHKLGGTVLAPPFDVPYSRMAVLQDPQGAVFTVSKYIPPDSSD